MVHKCSASLNQLNNTISFNSEPLIEEWPHSLPKGVITYRLENLSDDIENKKHQIKAITVAFRAWQIRIKDLKFRRVYDKTTTVDIPISFKPLSYFNNRKGVLAHAILPGQGVPTTIEINDEWVWVASGKWQTLSKPPLVPVMIHEIGHVLGLRHDTSDMLEIMYPSFDLGKRKYKLGKNTIKRIQERYGARKLSQRIIDLLIRRRENATDFR